MNDKQSQPPIPTSTYISIVLLMMVALSGTIYIIFYAINKPPFDVELALEVATKNDVQCINGELIKRNIPHENVEHLEKHWIVLRSIEDKNETKSVQLNECSASL